MNGYTELIQVIGAMVIFSMILLNANAITLRNNLVQIQGELEQEVIALGQEIIEEAMARSFDRVTAGAAMPPTQIPEGFTPADELGPDPGESNRSDFDDFDDYDGWTETVETEHGIFNLSAEVFYVHPDTFQPISSPSTFKKIVVTVTSEFLTRRDGERIDYRLEFIRNYYAD